jgi:hypothetical protein
MNILDGWENFYVIVGSSAGALIGLQFVVITLLAEMPISGGDMQASGIFTTPSVIHFSVVLLLSAIISAPWDGVTPVAVAWGIIGLCGAAYAVLVACRLRSLTMYQPVFEDWLFHVLLPFAAYALMMASACTSRFQERAALFGAGGASLLLLFTGIHNAWDLVTHMIFVRKRKLEELNNREETK